MAAIKKQFVPLRRLFVGLVVAIVISELFCRLVLGLGDPPLYVADPQIEYLMKPNQDVRRFGNRVLVNEWGMRSNAFAARKVDREELRVMVFGDSVVNGGSLTDHEQVSTRLMEVRLQQQLQRAVIVGNISAGSWGPGNWLAYLRRYGTFDADVVVLVVNSGDYADNPTFEPLNPSTQPTAKPVLALQEAISRYLPRYLPRQWQTPPELPPRLPDDSAVAKGLADLREFLVLAAHTGAKVLVLHHPDVAELASGTYQVGHDRMRELCIQLNIPFVGLSAAYGSAGGRTLYRDDIHPNAQGQEVIATVMLQAIGELKLWGADNLQPR